MKRRNEVDMINGSIAKNVLRFAIPLILNSLLYKLYHSADTIIVGRFAGSTPMAAVGSTGSLVALLINLFTGLGAGINVMAARFCGSKEYDKLSDYVHTALTFSALLGLVVAVIGIVISRPVLRLMNVEDGILNLSTLYLQLYFLGTPFNLVYSFVASVFRALGDSARSLRYSALSGMLNVVLNLIFVVWFRLSVAGVAIATVISQILSCVLIVRDIMTTDGPHRLQIKKLRIRAKPLWDIVRIGLPVGLNATVFNFANVSIQSAINSLGPVVMAGNAAATTLDGLIAACMSSFYNAVTPFVSQNLGARKYDRVGKVVGTCMLYSFVIGIVLAAGIRLLGTPLLGIFVPADDPLREDVIAAGLVRLTVVALPYFLCGIMDVSAGALRGMGKSWTPFIISVIGTCVVRIAWVSIVFPLAPRADVLYLCFPISWLVTFVVTTAFLPPCLRKIKKQMLATV